MRQEQPTHVGKLGKEDTLKGFFNPDNKRSISYAIGRGAVFGAGGNIVGGLIADTPVGEAIKEGFSRIGRTIEEYRPNMNIKLLHVPGVIDAVGEIKDSLNLGTPEIKLDTPIVGGIVGIKDTVGAIIPDLPFETQTPETSVETSVPEAPSVVESGHVIQAGPDSPEIKVPDNLQPQEQWIAGANDINKDYGLMKQAEVGAMLPKIDELLTSQGLTDADPNYEAMRNHLQHIAEQKVNEVYDSHLQEAVANHMSLDQVKESWQNNFSDWIDQGEMAKDMVPVIQIDSIALQPDTINSLRTIPPGLSFESVLNNTITPEGWKGLAPWLGSHIAANIDVLNEGWHRTFPTEHFPVKLGEISTLVHNFQNGDLNASEKLKSAFRGLSQGEKIRLLTDSSYQNVWAILEQMK